MIPKPFPFLSRNYAEVASAPGAEQNGQPRPTLQGVTYVLPKDLPEDSRLDFQHSLLRAILGSNFAAPIHQGMSRMLDVATGTGRWAGEMARAYPHTQVTGFDLVAPETKQAMPENYTFVQGNLFAGLPFPENVFAYVHQRFLVLALPTIQWPIILSELHRVTEPGGYVELVEGGGTFLRSGSATRQLQTWWSVASTVYGIDVALMAHLPRLLRDAGFHAIHQQTYRVPVGSWGGRVGTMLETDILASLPAIKPFVCRHAAVSPDLFDTVVKALPAEWKRYETCYEYYLAYGQKGA